MKSPMYYREKQVFESQKKLDEFYIQEIANFKRNLLPIKI